MKIKRFFAADIRQAMRMVKEELGADAVIMSNRPVDGGIEIVAARDFDEQSIHNTLQEQITEQQPPRVHKTKKLQEQATGQQQPTEHKAKKIVLPNFEAAKKRLKLLDSQRKQNAAASFVSEQPVRPHRFSTDPDTSAIPGSRSPRFPTDCDTSAIHGSRKTWKVCRSDYFQHHAKRRPEYP